MLLGTFLLPKLPFINNEVEEDFKQKTIYRYIWFYAANGESNYIMKFSFRHNLHNVQSNFYHVFLKTETTTAVCLQIKDSTGGAGECFFTWLGSTIFGTFLNEIVWSLPKFVQKRKHKIGTSSKKIREIIPKTTRVI